MPFDLNLNKFDQGAVDALRSVPIAETRQSFLLLLAHSARRMRQSVLLKKILKLLRILF